MEPNTELPIKDLDLVLQVCEPGEPLLPGDKRYADFSVLRQGVGIGNLQKELNIPPLEGQYHHNCLCGHRGSGKSTELLSLKDWADKHEFLAVRIEVDTEFGMIDLAFSDLFLLAATAAEEAMQAFGKPLPQAKLRRVLTWFSEVMKEGKETVKSELSTEADAQLGGSIFSFAKLIAKLKAGVKAGSSHATTTREKIRNYPDTLMEMTNDLLHTADEILAESGKRRGLLLLFDNLDRYEPERIDRVLFKSSEIVRRMACHAVFTLPISLEYEPLSGAIQDCYGFSTVLPMLSLRHKSDTWVVNVTDSKFNPTAIAAVRAALGLRVDIDQLFEDPHDADLLIKMSGGCIRDLMHLVSLAFRHTRSDTQFTSDGVLKAIREMRATYIRRLTIDDIRLLVDIARHEPISEVGKDVYIHRRRLLYNRYALEYLDENDEPYVDVHPLVIEIEEFRNAFNSASPLAEH